MADLSRIATAGYAAGQAVADQGMTRSFGLMPSSAIASKSFDSLQGGWVATHVHDDVLYTGGLHVTLRPWTAADAAEYQRLLSDPDLWTYLPERFDGPLSASDARDLLHLAMQDDLNITRAVIWLGQPVGQVRLTQSQDGPPELSYWIGKPFRGNGLARKAVQAFLADIQDRARGVFARVHKDNTASKHLLSSLGFAAKASTTSDLFLHFARSE